MACGLALLFPLAFALGFGDSHLYGITPLFIIVLSLPLIGLTALTIAGVYFARGWSTLSSPIRLFAAAVIGLVGSGDVAYVARNVAVVLLTPYFLVGLAVVHCFARQAHSRNLLLIAFYSLLMIFFVFAAMLIAALGVAEQWVGIRRRLGRSPPAAND